MFFIVWIDRDTEILSEDLVNKCLPTGRLENGDGVEIRFLISLN